MTTIPISKFLEVLAAHVACDKFLTCMKLTPELWRQWRFGDGGAEFIAAGFRDWENYGAVMFEALALERAEIVKTVSGGETWAVQ